MRSGQVNLQPYCIQRPETKGHLTSITAHNPQPIGLDVIAIFVQRSDGCVHLGLWNTQCTFHPKPGTKPMAFARRYKHNILQYQGCLLQG